MALMTDEYGAYRGLGKEFASHETVTHKAGEYVRGHVYTNTAESFNGLLKRAITGAFHSVSRRHLDLYLDEFQFRWNARDMTDEGHTAIAIQGADGKRLTYGARGHPQDARDGGWGCGPCLDDGRSRRAVGDYREVDSAPPTTRRGSWSSVSASGSGGME